MTTVTGQARTTNGSGAVKSEETSVLELAESNREQNTRREEQKYKSQEERSDRVQDERQGQKQKLLNKVAKHPGLERDLTVEELTERIDDAVKRRKTNMVLLWALAAGVMIYGAAHITPFVSGFNLNPLLALMLSLIVDMGLVLSLMSDRFLSEYNIRDAWVLTGRVITGLYTFVLNTAQPVLALITAGPDANYPYMIFSVILHSTGSVILIVITEMAISVSRHISSTIKMLDDAKQDKMADEEAERQTSDALSEQLTDLQSEFESSKLKIQNLEDQNALSAQQLEEADKKTQRAITLHTGRPAQGIAPGSGIGRALVNAFQNRYEKNEGMFVLGQTRTGYELTDALSPRMLITKVDGDTIYLVDTEKPAVQNFIGRKKQLGEQILPNEISSIQNATVMQTDLDLEREVLRLIQDGDFGNRNEYDETMNAFVSASADELSENVIARTIIRGVLGTGKVKQRYPKTG